MGFGFQGYVVSIVAMTGLQVDTFFQLIFPFFGLLTLTGVFVLVRQLTGRSRIALVSTVLMAIQPDFLFSLVRGNHEKLTFLLMFLAILMLARSMQKANWKTTATAILLIVGLSSMNFFYACSFAVILFASATFFMVTNRKDAREPVRMRHTLTTTGLLTSVFIGLFVFFLYAPASNIVNLAGSLLGQLRLFFLDLQPTSSPYGTIGTQWISTNVWLLTNALSWITIGVSSVVVMDSLTKNRLRLLNLGPESGGLLVALHLAFGVQLGAAIVIDFTGFLGANLELRVFSMFIVTSAAITSLALATHLTNQRGILRKATVVLVIMLLLFVGFARATNDPSISKRWIFYTGDEANAIQWVQQKSSHQILWSGFDERIRNLGTFMFEGAPVATTEYQINGDGQRSTMILISENLRLQAEVRGVELPDVSNASLVYSNGASSVFIPAPLTPYQ